MTVLKYRLLTVKEVAATIGCSRNHVWRMVKKGQLPPPLKISTRIRAWRSDEIENFMNEKDRERYTEREK